MPYNPSSDFVGLWRAVSGGVEKAEMPGMDFVLLALQRAGLIRMVTSQTAPTTNQSTTAWFKPLPSSFSGEGSLFLWDPSLNMYVPATPELFHGGSTGGGGGGDGGGSGGEDMAIISGTQPSSPAAGQQWWNGTIMQVWDGTAWKTVGPPAGPTGTPLETSTLVFSLAQPENITLPGAIDTFQIVPYVSAPIIDTMTGWDPITRKYKPTKAGYYALSVRGQPIATGGAAALAVVKNDDGVLDNADTIIGLQNSTMAGGIWLTLTCFSQMNGITDFVRVFGYSHTSSMPGVGTNPAISILRMP